MALRIGIYLGILMLTLAGCVIEADNDFRPITPPYTFVDDTCSGTFYCRTRSPSLIDIHQALNDNAFIASDYHRAYLLDLEWNELWSTEFHDVNLDGIATTHGGIYFIGVNSLERFLIDGTSDLVAYPGGIIRDLDDFSNGNYVVLIKDDQLTTVRVFNEQSMLYEIDVDQHCQLVTTHNEDVVLVDLFECEDASGSLGSCIRIRKESQPSDPSSDTLHLPALHTDLVYHWTVDETFKILVRNSEEIDNKVAYNPNENTWLVLEYDLTSGSISVRDISALIEQANGSFYCATAYSEGLVIAGTLNGGGYFARIDLNADQCIRTEIPSNGGSSKLLSAFTFPDESYMFKGISEGFDGEREYPYTKELIVHSNPDGIYCP